MASPIGRGDRSLLVSHWPVASEATGTTQYRHVEANPDHGKTAAHQKAVLALMDTPDHPEYAHPLFWAPFVVVGEGGAQKKVSSVPQKQSPQASSAINSRHPVGKRPFKSTVQTAKTLSVAPSAKIVSANAPNG
jgi:hypothetical protein